MTESAMSSNIWDGEGDPHSYKLKEWFFLKDELEFEKVNDPSLNLTKHEIAEQVLHEIEDLGRNDSIDWLDEFPLFDEIQTLTPVGMEVETEAGKVGNDNLKSLQGGEEKLVVVSPNDEPMEIQKQPSVNQDLFTMGYENAATFTLSDENILYINNHPFVTITPFQPLENTRTVKCREENVLSSEETYKKDESSENGSTPTEFWSDLDSPEAKTEMEEVEEIVRNTALELESQWESETSQSEVSTCGTSSSEMSPKEKEEVEEEEEEQEEDDPEWKPDSVKPTGRICGKRSKTPYWRGGSTEEKKLRKKEQNKNAATRYRLKKKAEVNEILEEEKLLRERKSELEEKAADIQNDIKCVKALLRELFQVKGIIN